MAESGGGSHDSNSGAWSKVPIWDGSPQTWRTFKREMEWWLAGLDLESTKRYNLAARWLVRQSGVVRQRGEEFLPSELEYQKAEKGKDPVTEEEVTLVEEDPLSGMRKLLRALEEMNGRTTLDKRGELRGQFYLELRRKPGERISEFSTRFRTLVADLKAEGVSLPTGELGWFYRSKLGLDPLRSQLLETALAGAESYEAIERETLRLFKDLHAQDPLARCVPHQRPPLLQRFLAQQSAPSSRPASSYAPSMTSSHRSMRSGSSTVSSGRPNTFKKPFSKQAYVSEAVEEAHDEPEEEAVEEESEVLNLEDVLKCEAEVLAAELEEAAECGVDSETLQQLEETVETAAEALLTMKEARSKLQEVCKDRGYGKTSMSGGSKGKTNPKKQSDKHPCFDCNLPGHWAGDPECQKPGQGLGRKPSPGKSQKHVKVVEAYNTEHSVEETENVHEAMMVGAGVIPDGLKLAFEQSHIEPKEVNVAHGLTGDKRLVGALDSACNRTCTGTEWLNSFLKELQKAPPWIQSLIATKEEHETFRFGNGGTQVSLQRWRLPTVVGGSLVCFWTSVVKVPSLGLLLGRDFLEAVGADMSFARRTLRCEHLNSKPIALKQLSAGHYLLHLLPEDWPGVTAQTWKRVGLDGILEVQLSTRDWLSRRLQGLAGPRHGKFESPEMLQNHDHLLTESSVAVGTLVHKALDFRWPLGQASMSDSDVVRTSSSTSSSTREPLRRSSTTTRIFKHARDCARPHDVEMAEICSSNAPTRRMGRQRLALVAVAKAILALSAITISGFYDAGAMGSSSTTAGFGWNHPSQTSPRSTESGSIHYDQHGVVHLPSREIGLEGGFLRRSNATRDVSGSPWKRHDYSDQEGRTPRSRRESSESRTRGDKGDGSKNFVGAQGWSAYSSSRFGGSGYVAASSGPRQGHYRSAEGESSPYGGDPEAKARTGSESEGQCQSGAKGFNEIFIGESVRETFAGGEVGKTAMGISGHVGERESGIGSSSRSSWKWKHSPALCWARGCNECGVSKFGSGSRRSLGGASSSEHGGGLQGSVGSSVWKSRLGGFDKGGYGEGAGSVNDSSSQWFNPYTIHQKLKKGHAQLIQQAWERHEKDRVRISQSPGKIRQILEACHFDEYQSFMNDEVFMQAVNLVDGVLGKGKPNPLVTEVFTTSQRVSQVASGRGHHVGDPLSLDTGWDFLNPECQRLAKEKIRAEKPYCLVIAFPCGPFSPLQRLNPNGSATFEKRLQDGRTLMKFGLELAEIQLQEGRHVVLENPLPSAAWKEPEMEKFINENEVRSAVFDQCRFRLRSAEGMLHKKPTQMVCSGSKVADMLDGRRCMRDHDHAPVLGGVKVTARAGLYPRALASAIVRGIEGQFESEYRPREVLASEAVPADEEVGFGDESALGFRGDEFSEDDVDDGQSDGKIVIPAAVKQTIKRLHENTGHRSGLRLARALVIAGAPQEAVLAAKRHRCDVCHEKKGPKARRPMSLPTPKDMGDQVHIDLVELEDAVENKFMVAELTQQGIENLAPEEPSVEVVAEASAPMTPAPRTPSFLPSSRHVLRAEESGVGVGDGADLPPLQAEELIGAVQPALMGASSVPMSSVASRRASELSLGSGVTGDLGSQAAGSAGLLSRQIERAQRLEGGGIKRPAEVQADEQGSRVKPRGEGGTSEVSCATRLFDVLEMSKEEILSVLADAENAHPLVRAFCEACVDRSDPSESQVLDHGTWSGRWHMPSQSEWKVREKLKLLWPTGNGDENESLAVQASRKEFRWSSMTDEQKVEFAKAAVEAWDVWAQNDAVEILSLQESERIRARLKAANESCKILTPRYVFTDKNDPVRSPTNPLPLKARGRIVVPGFKDEFSYAIRKDAPTASRVSQHMLFILTASNSKAKKETKLAWRLMSADVKSAFLKGDAYMDGSRELYLENVKGAPGEPRLPFGNALAKIRKGVFGLADAPRQWYLRLNRALLESGWQRSFLDYACWMLWSPDGTELEGVILSHVDDLLLGGNLRAQQSLLKLGELLGFGSIEYDDFVYCGKRICMREEGSISLSMVEYHQNLAPVTIPVHRRAHPESELSDGEKRQLRAILGSLQWLVAQLRFDMGYHLSTLQGERQTVQTLMKANALLKKFKQHDDFSLTFQPMDLNHAGIMVISDASLGNVMKSGGAEGEVLEKVYSQSAYFIIVADRDLMAGRTGQFAVLDARSHRLPRVCRSTFAAELLGTEEGLDMGQFCRMIFALFQGYPMVARNADRIMDAIPLIAVVDAKDVFDKGSSDTPTYGAQKSLAFTVAWIRNTLSRPNTSLKWTSTENMWVDAGTKDMDLSHIHKILASGRWSYVYDPAFVKQTAKGGKTKKPSLADGALPGEPLRPESPIFPYLHHLASSPGWHRRDGIVIHVARNARSFRTPSARYSIMDFPVRSTYGRFDSADGRSEWRTLEEGMDVTELVNPHGLLSVTAAVLISVYRSLATKDRNPLKNAIHDKLDGKERDT